MTYVIKSDLKNAWEVFCDCGFHGYSNSQDHAEKLRIEHAVTCGDGMRLHGATEKGS